MFVDDTKCLYTREIVISVSEKNERDINNDKVT